MADTYDEIVKKILDRKKELKKEDVEALIREKIEEYGDIIRREAAALMVAKELGVELPSETSYKVVGRLSIKDLATGFRGVDISGVVIEMNKPGFTSDGRRYIRFKIADDTGAISVIAWDENIEKILATGIGVGDYVLLEKTIVKRYRGGKELLFSRNSSVKKLGVEDVKKTLMFVEKYGAQTLIIHSLHTDCYGERCCIYGLDPNDRIVVIIGEKSVLGNIKEMAYVFSGQGLYRKLTSNIIFAQCFKDVYMSPFINFLEVNKYEENLRKIVEKFGIIGIILGYVLFKKEGGRVVILENTGRPINIPIFSNYYLHKLAANVGKCVMILGIYKKQDAEYRSSKCLSVLEGLCPDKYVAENYRMVRLIDNVVGPIKTRASVVSARLYVNCTNEKPLFSLILRIDDGLGSVQVIANKDEILSKMLFLDIEELCSMDSGSREKIIDYSLEEILGKEFLFYGILANDNNNMLLSLQGVTPYGEEEEKA